MKRFELAGKHGVYVPSIKTAFMDRAAFGPIPDTMLTQIGARMLEDGEDTDLQAIEPLPEGYLNDLAKVSENMGSEPAPEEEEAEGSTDGA